MTNSTQKPKSLIQRVNKSKDCLLKTRLQTLIKARGLSEPQFYNDKLQISRQFWYFISWGIWDCPVHLKVKIAKALDTDSSVIFINEEKEK